MNRTRDVKRAMAVLATPALLLGAPSPASAVFSVMVDKACGYRQMCAGYAQDVPGPGTGPDVAVSCSAYTPYEVQATLVQCYILGNAGDVHYTPVRLTQGQAATLTYIFDSWSLLSRTYRICTGAGYYSNDGTYHPPAGFRCGAVI